MENLIKENPIKYVLLKSRQRKRELFVLYAIGCVLQLTLSMSIAIYVMM